MTVLGPYYASLEITQRVVRITPRIPGLIVKVGKARKRHNAVTVVWIRPTPTYGTADAWMKGLRQK